MTPIPQGYTVEPLAGEHGQVWWLASWKTEPLGTCETAEAALAICEAHSRKRQ